METNSVTLSYTQVGRLFPVPLPTPINTVDRTRSSLNLSVTACSRAEFGKAIWHYPSKLIMCMPCDLTITLPREYPTSMWYRDCLWWEKTETPQMATIRGMGHQETIRRTRTMSFPDSLLSGRSNSERNV